MANSNSSPLSQGNRMGTAPVGKLLASMAWPLMLSMLVQACYNMVDSLYVSRLGESAVTAMGLAFPVQNMQIGFASGIAVGVNALLSKSLGENNRERASKAAGTGILLVLIAGVVFLLFGIFGARPFFEPSQPEPSLPGTPRGIPRVPGCTYPFRCRRMRPG